MKTALITVLAAIGVLTSACASQGAGAASQPAASYAAAAQANTAQPDAMVAGGAGAHAAAAPCLTRYLSVSPGPSQGTPGSTYQVLVFRNLNNHACTLYGYPGVSLGGGTPVHQIGRAAAENPATPRLLVKLPAHGKAYALLQIVHAASYPPGSCHPTTAHWLIVYPPNQTVPVYVWYKVQTCAKKYRTMTVSAVRSSSSAL